MLDTHKLYYILYFTYIYIYIYIYTYTYVYTIPPSNILGYPLTVPLNNIPCCARRAPQRAGQAANNRRRENMVGVNMVLV